MIIVRLMGGMGNQMFQYAAAYNLGRILQQKILIDKSEYLFHRGRSFGLRELKLCEITKNRLGKLKYHQYKLKKWIVEFYERNILNTELANSITVRGLYRYGIVVEYNEVETKIHWDRLTHKNMIYLSGFFQGVRYFKEYEAEIKKLYIDKILTGRNVTYENKICVHIRCGDYIGNPHFQVCTQQYYIDAVNVILDKFPDAVPIIFSDDIKYVKKNMQFPFQCIFSNEKREKRALDEMRKCRYFVLSNSSFSWWAQELCEYKNKIVTAPAYWHGKTGIFEKNWILVDV